ncbi:MAG: MIP/aquaporin family protein [Gemmatimonadota bacterium]
MPAVISHPDVPRHLGHRSAAEALGTFFLVFMGTGAIVTAGATGGIVAVALAFAFVILAMVYAIGHLSGAHLNPAVTLAFWSIGRFPARDVPAYVAAQCVGAIAASLTLRTLVGTDGGLGQTVPSIPGGAAFAVEFLLTFALMFVVTAVASDERVTAGFAGLAVGLTIGFDVLMGGPLTGASMNPARSLGPAVAASTWTAHWLYWIAPIAGAIAGAWCYDFLRPAAAPGTVPRGEVVGVAGPIDANR